MADEVKATGRKNRGYVFYLKVSSSIFKFNPILHIGLRENLKFSMMSQSVCCAFNQIIMASKFKGRRKF